MVLGFKIRFDFLREGKKNLAKKMHGAPPCHAPRKVPQTEAATWSAMGRPTHRAMCKGRMASSHAAHHVHHHASWRAVWHGAPHSKLRGGLRLWRFTWRTEMVFSFFGLAPGISSLLTTKKSYILRFVSKDLSHGHLRWSRLSCLVCPISFVLSCGRTTLFCPHL